MLLDRPYERIVLSLFGGQADFVRATGISQTTVSSWGHEGGGIIPHRHHITIVNAAKRLGLKINPTDFLTLPKQKRRA